MAQNSWSTGYDLGVQRFETKSQFERARAHEQPRCAASVFLAVDADPPTRPAVRVRAFLARTGEDVRAALPEDAWMRLFSRIERVAEEAFPQLHHGLWLGRVRGAPPHRAAFVMLLH